MARIDFAVLLVGFFCDFARCPQNECWATPEESTAFMQNYLQAHVSCF